MDWSVSVQSSISSDTEPTVVVNFESGKYIFNAGENTGRSRLETKRNWRKTRGVWLTSVGTQRCSGLPGLVMFLADAGIQDVQIGGPQGLTHYLASMRSCLHRESMSVAITEISSSPEDTVPAEPQPIYKDTNISMYGLTFYPQLPTATLDIGETSASAASQSNSSKRKRATSPNSSSKRQTLDDAGAKVIDDMGVDEAVGSAGSQGPSGPPSDLAIAQALEAELDRVDGSPSLLAGVHAELWRSQMVKRMFPADPLPEEKRNLFGALAQKQQQKHQQQKGGKGRKPPAPPPPPPPQEPPKRQITVDATAVYKVMTPLKDRQLPHFSHCRDAAGREIKPVMGYVVVGPQSRGKFDIVKGRELGVPNGPLIGKLTKGETVTFRVKDKDGNVTERTVKPEQCMGPPECPKVMILLDVPSPLYITSVTKSFKDSPFYAKLRSKNEKDVSERLVHVIVHICGEGVLEDPRYQEFMNGFSDQTHHLVASRAYCPDPMTFTSVAYNQLRLNKLDSEMFPVQKFRLESELELSTLPDLPPRTSILRSNEWASFRPFKPPASDELAANNDAFHPAVVSGKDDILPEVVARRFANAQQRVRRFAETERELRPGDDVIVVPLGTSSALPTKFRNVSSTFIQIPGYGGVLLDAGEGTWGQLARLYGDNHSRQGGVWDIMRDLRCIFLSHMHGDHHIGLAKILAMRKLLVPAPTQPLYVVGLRHVPIYLREIAEMEDLGLDDGPNGVITIASETLNLRDLRDYEFTLLEKEPYLDVDASRAAAARMCASLGLESFNTIDVQHRTKAFGLVMRHTDGWGIAFSGDTMPSNLFARAGQDVTLLVHEASMSDDQADVALAKAHSTTGQAIEVGKRMRAENILLTHFSARYPKMPPQMQHGSPRRGQTPVVAFAFDHARIRLGDMWKLSMYMPAMESNFRDIAQMLADDEEPTTNVSW